jgi:hypothetical protein
VLSRRLLSLRLGNWLMLRKLRRLSWRLRSLRRLLSLRLQKRLRLRNRLRLQWLRRRGLLDGRLLNGGLLNGRRLRRGLWCW